MSVKSGARIPHLVRALEGGEIFVKAISDRVGRHRQHVWRMALEDEEVGFCCGMNVLAALEQLDLRHDDRFGLLVGHGG